MKEISEKTLIPIGVAVIVIGSCAAWVARVEATQTNLKERQDRQGVAYQTIVDSIQDLKLQAARIEGKLDNMRK